MANSNYQMLASAPIQDNREIVISRYMDGSYTLAQRINVEEGGGRTTNVYMKNSIHIPTVEGLEKLKDAIDTAINIIESENNLI